MSFNKIYLKTLEELLSQMKDVYNQTYMNNAREIIALEHAINYIKLSTEVYDRLEDKITKIENKKNVLEIKGFDNLIEILKYSIDTKEAIYYTCSNNIVTGKTKIINIQVN